MKRKWLKITGWILLTPFCLFFILMVLLYVPSVQGLLRREVSALASQATDMGINVDRVDLRFPFNLLVRGVEVVQENDTLLTLGSLNVRIQALPLFRGKVEIDEITLDDVTVNTSTLMQDMSVKGSLGRFHLESHGVDLLSQTVILNAIELSDTHLDVVMSDTSTTVTTQDTIPSSPLNWKVNLHRMGLDNVSVNLCLLPDTLCLKALIGTASATNAVVDLGQERYALGRLTVGDTNVSYDMGTSAPSTGLDPSHICLRDIGIGMDSLLYCGKTINAVIANFSLSERSGFTVSSMSGKVASNDTIINIPSLSLRTPYSEIGLSAHVYWDLVDVPTTGQLSAFLDAYIGKEDLFLLAGDFPQGFKDSYPTYPLVMRAGTNGNLSELQLSRLSVELPGAFSLNGGGVVENLADSLTRKGLVTLDMHTQDLGFLTSLAGEIPESSFIIPDSMDLSARILLNGPEYSATLQLSEQQGSLDMDASINTSTEVYQANLSVDNLQLHHFLPQDSIYELSCTLSASGQGLDVTSPQSHADMAFNLQNLRYANLSLSGIQLTGKLSQAVATARLSSDNSLLGMSASAGYNLAATDPEGEIDLTLTHIDFEQLGVMPELYNRNVELNLSAYARKDSIAVSLNSGDMALIFKSRMGVYPLLDQATAFTDVLMGQLEGKQFDHAVLRQELPSASLAFKAGQDNPLAWYLEEQNIHYNDITVKLGATPDWGLNGMAAVHAFKMDTLSLDTIFFTAHQDTTLLRLKGEVISQQRSRQPGFSASLTGEIRNQDTELVLELKDGQDETGILLGINARPLIEGQGKGNGLVFKLIPENPVIAYRPFSFYENCNWIYLHHNMRVYANVDMRNEEGIEFNMRSLPNDTVSLQNIDVELRKLPLDELSAVIPYCPSLAGLFSLEAHYIQTQDDFQVAAQLGLEDLVYEGSPIGSLSLGATYLPADSATQYFNAFLDYEDNEVLLAQGMMGLTSTAQDSLMINAATQAFPLQIANAFLPQDMMTLQGTLTANVNVCGNMDQPSVNGEIKLDSVNLTSPMYGVSFHLANDPLVIADNKLDFNKYAIYTTGTNPFLIDGNVDFLDLSNPTANLVLSAENFTLLDAKQTKQSLLYGKVFADFNAAVTGPLSELSMRGQISLLGNTDVSYVLTDSPLTVQDRLGSLVTFTSFNDTTTVAENEITAVSLGGLDMLMMVHIDQAVRVKVDLDKSNDNRIELEGGGDLTMKYIPQGELTLTGRYTLTDGLMKYALPVVAAKEFKIDNGSYVDWTGDPMDPTLNFTATDRIKASVTEGEDTRMVNFDVSIVVKNRLENLEFAFDVSSPEDATIQNELTAMGAEERGKQALYIMVAKTYLGTGGMDGLVNLDMGSALNSVLSSQINELMGNIKGASISVGIEDYDESGSKRTDYSFSYSQKFFNDRFQIVIGGKVSQGDNVTNDAESFIDNISFEYRLDRTGTRYVRLFYDKNYESVLEGEITETGVGLVLRKRLDKVSELFIFKRKGKSTQINTQ